MVSDTAREPPANLDAERSVLGAVLLKPAALAELRAHLEVADWHLPAHREVWAAMLAVERRGMPVDIVSLADELKARGALARLDGGEAYLTTLAAGVPTAENVAHYARIVREKAALRELIRACGELAARAYGGGDAGETLAAAQRAVGGLAVRHAGGGKDPVTLGVAVKAALDAAEEASRTGQAPGIPTGLRAWDDLFGGHQRQRLCLVAAQPGAGKSALGIQQWGLHAARLGYPVLVLSGEMSVAEQGVRFVSGAAEVDSRRLAAGQLDYATWRRITEASGGLAGLPLWIDDSVLTLGTGIAKARRWHGLHAADGKHALIVWDYVQITRAPGETREQQVAAVTSELKALATDLDCSVVGISSLNREGAKREGGAKMHDLRGSGSTEYDANMVVFVEGERPPAARASDIVPMRLKVEKNRGGPCGTINVGWCAATTSWHDATDDGGNADLFNNWQDRDQ